MDRLTSMDAFVRAVELGSFSAAADALDLSAPMVGKHVRFLEDRLGVRLLNRTTRRQSLTDFGRAYFERCRAILAEVEGAEALAADHLGEVRGRLRVTMPALLGRYCVAPLLFSLAQRHPGVDLILSFGDSLVDLVEDGCDIAIRTGDLEAGAAVMTRRVARQRMIVCAAPSYLEAHGHPKAIDDLSKHTTIAYRRTGPIRPWLFPRAGAAPARFDPASRLQLDDMDAIADAAVAGMGLAWLPSWLVRGRIERGELAALLPGEPAYPYDCHALWLHRHPVPAKVRLVIDTLASELPRRLAWRPGERRAAEP
jgi:DNA-binding transcriptional LysR family regulator